MYRTLLVVMLAVLAVEGCSTRTRRASEEPPVVLEVDNQAALDMTIYVVQSSGSRERLGLAVAHRVSWFRIPDRLIFGLTPLRFQADPIGGGAMPVTEDITVEPGDTVVLRIPVGGRLLTVGRTAALSTVAGGLTTVARGPSPPQARPAHHRGSDHPTRARTAGLRGKRP